MMQNHHRKILSVNDIIPNKIYMVNNCFVRINVTKESGWLRGYVDAVYDQHTQSWCASCEDVYTSETVYVTLTRVADSLIFAKFNFPTLLEIEDVANVKTEQLKFDINNIENKLEDLNKQLVKFELCLKENATLGDSK